MDLASQATHDYLKTIYELCERYGRATTGRIAEELNITPASVTGMLKKMAAMDPPLLDYRKHQGVALTEAGEKQALTTIRRHRLLECFLHQTLGYSWDEVHEEAERLEHAISENLDQRIAEFLEEPQRDPHGSPIPTRDLEIDKGEVVSLDIVDPPCQGRVQCVSDHDAALLRYLAEIGLTPGTELRVVEPHPFSDHIRIELGGCDKTLSISKRVAAAVFLDAAHETGDATQHPMLQENN